jgi:hypothetical protein
MGVDFYSSDGKFYFTWWAWRRVFDLAIEHGWEPAGTEAPSWEEPDGCTGQPSYDPKEWNGGYFSNDGQYVTPEDARNLADALERVINDMPEYENCSLARDKEYLRDFVDFCRKPTGFSIW